MLHPSPLNPPSLGDFYQPDSCSPQNWQGCFILAKNRWGDGEMGRWGEFWTNSRNFGQIYLTLIEG
ncbi:MAG: hypothetical protein F6K26_30440 [Moorea sp. SIO2I5]|nr:hypothetical protein [Moorena sp. SIO2I5]